jgi:hypothetical protein
MENTMSFTQSHRVRSAGLAIVVAGCLCLLGTPATAWDWTSGMKVVGSGQITTTQRQLTGVKGVSVELPCNVEIVQGGAESVVIVTDDNIAPLVETVVENDQLKIRLVHRVASVRPTSLKITVNARTVERISISGSGSVAAEKLQSPSLDANISGSGNVRIASLSADLLRVSIAGNGDFSAGGRADTVRASISGSGDLKTGMLAAKNVKMSIAGSGDAKVWASQTLNVSIAGSGDVGYYGDAAVTQSVAGSGRITKLGAAPGPGR